MNRVLLDMKLQWNVNKKRRMCSHTHRDIVVFVSKRAKTIENVHLMLIFCRVLGAFDCTFKISNLFMDITKNQNKM